MSFDTKYDPKNQQESAPQTSAPPKHPRDTLEVMLDQREMHAIRDALRHELTRIETWATVCSVDQQAMHPAMIRSRSILIDAYRKVDEAVKDWEILGERALDNQQFWVDRAVGNDAKVQQLAAERDALQKKLDAVLERQIRRRSRRK